MPGSSKAGEPAQAVALHDARPLFEKALVYGVQHGIIGTERLVAMHLEAAKGMVQIARYFGSEFLRPELERARERMVNFISLHLEHETAGDLAAAARLLADHSLLSRSKAGTDLLRQLIALPESSHFGMQGQDEAQVSLLALWSLRSYAQYREELERRSRIGQAVQAALWLAERHALEDEALEEGDAEGVIRTALVLQTLGYRGAEWPSVAAFRKLLGARRSAGKALAGVSTLPSPKGLPPPLQAVVDAQKPVVLADLGKLLDPRRPLGTLLRTMSALRNRYFLLEDPLDEVDEYLRAAAPLNEDDAPPAAASKTWQRTTQGENDEAALLTLFLCLAVGVPKKTLLPEKAAKALVRKLRTKGWEPGHAETFIAEHAPEMHSADFLALWRSFVAEARATLEDDRDVSLGDALALLRRECHVGH
ncbi:MAG: hypothetical protein M9919_10145 [Burkholderiaceae bacterium]|jgi:hypothetical protein|nr:hypothetical protein [Burkholderiaceae bacterium]MCO5104352.1 hypothetical protein [Burkholderiaceae bacterium]